MDISAILDAEYASGCFYILDACVRHEGITEDRLGLSMLIGGGIRTLICLGTINPIFWVIAGIFVLVFAVIGLIRGWDDLTGDHPIWGAVEIILSIAALIFGVRLIRSGVTGVTAVRSGGSSSEHDTTNSGTRAEDTGSISDVEEDYIPGEYLAGDAPYQVPPGVRTLEGVHTTNSGTAQPWVAYYDEYGRLIARTDYNAPNPSAGIPSTHYHLYNWTDGTPYRNPNHYPGEYQP